ncbi:hypothetical protein [Nocardioides gilvus]|uniref:hypothetical protein n=1 Tax=Nocardioides gilvus TaxID=1735589 RepID=UPI0013A5ADF8|nr:hypothetical protein [Nocardioides gilvus]
MAQRTFLHIGPPKTGSSYLQAIWRDHKEELATQGLLYPGTRGSEHFRAFVSATKNSLYYPRQDERARGTWDRFIREVETWSGDAVISSEHFSRVRAESVEPVLARLSEVSDEVHVVITARDLARQVLASWQQAVKTGSSKTFDTFWTERAEVDPENPTAFWRGQDLPRLIRRWGATLPPGHVHLVVHGPRGTAHDRLWHQLCEVTGTDPSVLTEANILNESLGVAEIEALRRVNEGLPKKRNRVGTNTLTSKFLTAQARDLGRTMHRPRITPEAHAWATERSRAMVAELRDLELDLEVVGDLDDLLVDPTPPTGGRLPEEVSDDEVREVTTALMGRLLMHAAENRDSIRALQEENSRLRQSVKAADQGTLREHAVRSAKHRLRALRRDA